jgi:hypothetical protein
VILNHQPNLLKILFVHFAAKHFCHQNTKKNLAKSFTPDLVIKLGKMAVTV